MRGGRYVSQGKGILQPHHILDALDEVQSSGGRALVEGPFLDVLRSAQVRRARGSTRNAGAAAAAAAAFFFWWG